MRKVLFALSLFFCSAAFGQGGYFQGPKIESQSTSVMPIPGLTITACLLAATGTPCTPTVSVFSDQALQNPIANLQTDGDGYFAFWIAPGTYQWCASDPNQGRVQPYCNPFSVGAANGTSPSFINLTLSGNEFLSSTSLLCWNSDTGFSRAGAAQLNLGTCAAGNTTGELLLKTVDAGPASSTGVIINGTAAPGLNIGQSAVVGFNNGVPNTGTVDVGLSRITGGVLGLGNGAAGNITGFLKVGGLQVAPTANSGFDLGFSLTGTYGFGFSGILGWTAGLPTAALDTGFTRTGAATLALGNGTASNASGTLALAAVTTATINQTAATTFAIKDNNAGTRFSIPSNGTGQGQINNTSLTGASTANTVNLFSSGCPPQGPTSSINGTGAAADIFTCALPVNVIENNKLLHVVCSGFHDTGTTSVTLTMSLNGQNVVTGGTGTTASQSFSMEAYILRTGTTTGQAWGIVPTATGNSGTMVAFSVGLTGLSWTSGTQTLNCQFNVTAGDHVTGRVWAPMSIQ